MPPRYGMTDVSLVAAVGRDVSKNVGCPRVLMSDARDGRTSTGRDPASVGSTTTLCGWPTVASAVARTSTSKAQHSGRGEHRAHSSDGMRARTRTPQAEGHLRPAMTGQAEESRDSTA